MWRQAEVVGNGPRPLDKELNTPAIEGRHLASLLRTQCSRSRLVADQMLGHSATNVAISAAAPSICPDY